jgi:hypothetical protein
MLLAGVRLQAAISKECDLLPALIPRSALHRMNIVQFFNGLD